MSIYSPNDDDEFVITLKEWVKNNPLQPEDFQEAIQTAWGSKFGFQKGMIPWNKGMSPSIETRIKCGLAAKRKIMTDLMRDNYRKSKTGEKNPNFGKSIPDDVKEKLRLGMLGRKIPEISEWHKNNDHHTKHMVVCPHCGKEGKSLVMKRWHFDNCKNQSSSS